ncbi:DNA/RNA nuclease SfsA [Motiliproteus coralliicola]|uniref:Sugar fermentation stimulation protein homolog n=1 Tax=Motiliproteus coralliicola TaxID=2283196 RepID=A0A369W7R8_9GAMM|nr:DNA/RNA nuclease SfsA [Motiliproteus coralliicola]RDE18050.1 DNA/RNA nuclease SfsA [Motiliproteus coralliicola]
MKYEQPLQPARLLKRYKRFLADVELADGTLMTLHCPNTGSMRNCAEPGSRVWYRDSLNPKRKYPCTWELVEVEDKYLASVNTARANGLVEEAILNGWIAELQGYPQLRREVRYGEENSRIDLLLSQQPQGRPDCYVEVKQVTLLQEEGVGRFPDAVTERGRKHLRELEQMVAQGHRAVLLFCVPHTGIEAVEPADQIDPAYGQALRQAQQAGVELLAYQAEISPERIELVRQLPVRLD